MSHGGPEISAKQVKRPKFQWWGPDVPIHSNSVQSQEITLVLSAEVNLMGQLVTDVFKIIINHQREASEM